jgi:hypothetical protein
LSSEINLSRAAVVATIVSIWRGRLNAALTGFVGGGAVLSAGGKYSGPFSPQPVRLNSVMRTASVRKSVFHYKVARKFKSVSIIAGEDTKARVCRFPATGII